jgi:hypothetical protein
MNDVERKGDECIGELGDNVEGENEANWNGEKTSRAKGAKKTYEGPSKYSKKSFLTSDEIPK